MKFSKKEIDKLILEELKSVINERNGRHPQEMTQNEIEAYSKATGPGGHLSTDKPEAPAPEETSREKAVGRGIGAGGTMPVEEYLGILRQTLLSGKALPAVKAKAIEAVLAELGIGQASSIAMTIKAALTQHANKPKK